MSTIDSSGVGELVSAYTTTMNRGAKLKLACLPNKVQDILVITQLITVFDVYDTEDEAVRLLRLLICSPDRTRGPSPAVSPSLPDGSTAGCPSSCRAWRIALFRSTGPWNMR